MDLGTEEFDVELLVGDGGGIGKVGAVGEVGFAVVFGGFVKEAAGNGFFELSEVHFASLILCDLGVGEVFFDASEFGLRESAIREEATLKVREVNP